MNAIFSPDRVYRYTLTRLIPVAFSFEPRKFSGATIMYIGLNPSTADETKNDPTIRRLINFSQRLGFTRMIMTNLFAFRATDPEVMKKNPEPIGEENDHWLKQCASESNLVVACWGNHGVHLNRSYNVRKSISNLHCFRRTSTGEPQHPLYLPSDTELIVL